jgi:hypothetical protein
MDINETVANYLAAWNQADAGARLAALEGLLTEDARYVDPLADVTGPGGLSELIGAVQGQFGGLPISLQGAVDAHHDVARFQWVLGDGVVIGADAIAVDADGRIRTVFGFIDKMPAAA